MTIKNYKAAMPSTMLMADGLVTGKYLYLDDELHKRCAKCREYWPADTEFFFALKGGDGTDNTCRACYIERRYPNGRSEQPCAQ